MTETLWHIHTTGYCSGIKRNETLVHATVWMNLVENVMLLGGGRAEQARECSDFLMGVGLYIRVIK